MILAFDTYYYENKAKTVCLKFDDWTAVSPLEIYSEVLEGIEEYVPGEFFRRELPCILSLLGKIDLTRIEAIVIDGYVYVDDEMKPGLGWHLYSALYQKVPVIGVAKSNFKTLNKLKTALIRGNSINPLFITSVGVDGATAIEKISSMAGTYRIPTLLKALDTLTKTRQGFWPG